MLEVSRIAFTIFGFPIYWYGICISGGMLLGLLITLPRTSRYSIDSDQLITFLLWAVPFALIGTRLGYVVSHWDEFSHDLMSIFALRQGGLAIHGGIISAIIAGIIYTRITKIDFWNLADMCAPGMILGQAVGRWGNFFNQEAFGVETNLPWAMYIAGAWRHPTFLYESLWNILVLFYLLWLSKREKTDGGIFLRYLIWYSVGRFMIEGVRADSAFMGGFRTAQLLSLAIIAGSLLFLWFLKRKKQAGIKEEIKL